MARIVSCRAVEIAPVDFKAVPEAAEVKRADLAERAHVMRVEYGDASGSPFSGVQEAVSVAIRLRLARLADAEMPWMVGIGNVDRLDAVDSLGEEDRLADDVEACRELYGIVARAEAHLPRIAHVDDPQTRFARDDVGKAVRDRDLAAVVHAVQTPDDLWCQRIGDVKGVKRPPRDAVERLAVKRNAHRPVVDAVHAEGRLLLLARVWRDTKVLRFPTDHKNRSDPTRQHGGKPCFRHCSFLSLYDLAHSPNLSASNRQRA